MIDVKTITRKRELLEPNDHGFSIHDRRDETIVGRKVEIGAGQVCDKLHSCTFRDCEIRLRSSGRVVAVATSNQLFEDCHIWAAQIQHIATWDAAFHRCYFRGKYSARFTGPVTDCDFSTATLISTTFLQDVPLGDVVWPPWPHVVIDSPSKNYADWSKIPKPAEFNRYAVWKTGIASVLNLQHAVDDPEGFWSQICDRDYVHTQRTE